MYGIIELLIVIRCLEFKCHPQTFTVTNGTSFSTTGLNAACPSYTVNLLKSCLKWFIFLVIQQVGHSLHSLWDLCMSYYYCFCHHKIQFSPSGWVTHVSCEHFLLVYSSLLSFSPWLEWRGSTSGRNAGRLLLPKAEWEARVGGSLLCSPHCYPCCDRKHTSYRASNAKHILPQLDQSQATWTTKCPVMPYFDL